MNQKSSFITTFTPKSNIKPPFIDYNEEMYDLGCMMYDLKKFYNQ